MTPDVEWSVEPSRPKGGQQVDADPMTLVAVHRPTGLTIRLPPVSRHSQHRRRVAIDEAIQWILLAVGER